jgi:tRNA U34 5-carboxymethylaminomethyl modifying GTPase MnmE/TrmE
VRLNTKAQLLANKKRIKDLKTNMKETKKQIKATFAEHSARCKTLKNKKEKAECMQKAKMEMENEMEIAMEEIKEELEYLKSLLGNKSTDKTRLKALKARVEELKKSLIQEAMMIDRCKNVRLS